MQPEDNLNRTIVADLHRAHYLKTAKAKLKDVSIILTADFARVRDHAFLYESASNKVLFTYMMM